MKLAKLDGLLSSESVHLRNSLRLELDCAQVPGFGEFFELSAVLLFNLLTLSQVFVVQRKLQTNFSLLANFLNLFKRVLRTHVVPDVFAIKTVLIQIQTKWFQKSRLTCES